MAVVAPEATAPALRTTADSVTASVSTGALGDQEAPVIVRSGLGAGTPMTWNSATCPAGAPVLEVIRSWTSASAAPPTGIVTMLLDAGVKT